MTTEADLLRVAAELQEVALQPEGWPEALSSFGALFGSKWTLIGAFDRDPHAGYAFLTQDSAGESDHLAFFRDHYNQPETNPAVKFLVTSRPGTVVLREQTFTDTEWVREKFYREIYRPRGLYHGLGVCVTNNSSHIALLGLNRPEAAGRFSDRELDGLRVALPHLRRALDVFLRFADLEARDRAHEAAWDMLRCGVVLIDDTGKVLWRNATAAALLALGDGLAVRNGSLFAVGANDNSALESLVRDAILASRGRGLRPGGALSIARRSHKRPFALLVSPLRIEHCVVRHPAAVVFVNDPESMPEPPTDALKRLYGLTSREARVAALLTGGASLADTAAALGISMHTARTHLRSVFRKTETRRQSELVALLARGPLALG
jgi:DNA-binding CsgD family transcriptional regulator/PAS domain-containing protein